MRLRLRFIVSTTLHGRASDTGISPEQGINAITTLARAVGLFPREHHGEVDVAQIEGGTALNVIPESAELALDVARSSTGKG